jgi:MFS family permease
MFDGRKFDPVYAWYVVVIMLLSNIVSLTDRMLISLLVVPVQQDLNLSDTQMGWAMGLAFGFFYSLAGMPLGRLVDRLHRTRLIAIGMLLWSIMTIASGLANSFWELFFARMGVGIGEAVLAPAAWSLVSDLFPLEKRAKALSVVQLGGIVGAGTGYLLGGLIFRIMAASHGIAGMTFNPLSPWRIVFIAAAIPGLVLILFVLAIREPRAATRIVPVPIAEVVAFLRGEGRSLLPIFFGLAGLMVTVFSISSWAPTLIARKFHWGSEEIGFALGLAALCGGVPGTLFGGWLTDRAVRVGRHQIYAQLMVIGAVGVMPLLFFLPRIGDAHDLIFAIGIFYFVALLPNGVIVAWSQQVAPPWMRGTIGALNILCGNLIGYSGPAIVALVSDRFLGGKQHIGEALAWVSLAAAAFSLVLFVLYGRAAVTLVRRTMLVAT